MIYSGCLVLACLLRYRTVLPPDEDDGSQCAPQPAGYLPYSLAVFDVKDTDGFFIGPVLHSTWIQVPRIWMGQLPRIFPADGRVFRVTVAKESGDPTPMTGTHQRRLAFGMDGHCCVFDNVLVGVGGAPSCTSTSMGYQTGDVPALLYRFGDYSYYFGSRHRHDMRVELHNRP